MGGKTKRSQQVGGCAENQHPEKSVLLTLDPQRKARVGPVQTWFVGWKLYAPSRCCCGGSSLIESSSHEKVMILFVRFLFVSIHFQNEKKNK